MNAVTLRRLVFSYPGDSFRLSIDSWDVPSGARAGVFGPSGCGKSTLLTLLSGERSVQAGELEVAGAHLDQLGEAARRRHRLHHIGFIFQDHPLIDYLDVMDNVLLPYRLDPNLHLDEEVQHTASSLLEELGLPDMHQRRPHALSQGERQRVAIARALVTRPRLLLADEPTAGLDPTGTDAVMALLESACAARDMTLVMVTHDPRLRSRFSPCLDLGASS